VLEERDVQIRGHRVRLPLDVMLIASANPDDYTSRGRIITPLKDRFGSQIRTHYPLTVELEQRIMLAEATPPVVGDSGVTVAVPEHLMRVVAEFSHLARSSNHVNQRSGVSVRLSVANYEALAANALRRALRSGESEAVARIDDLDALAATSIGKIEIEALEDGREGVVFENLLRQAVLSAFRDLVDPSLTTPVVEAFEEGAVAHTGEGLPSAELAALASEVPGLADAVAPLVGPTASEPAVASAVEFVLEGLHLSRRLNKDEASSGVTYRSRS
jgi:magnesium chelatase subunit I